MVILLLLTGSSGFVNSRRLSPGLISKAVRHDTVQRCIRSRWYEWHHTFILECQTTGLNIDFPWTTLEQPGFPRQGDMDACLQCRQLFSGRAPWSVHAFKKTKKHGRINWRRNYISGDLVADVRCAYEGLSYYDKVITPPQLQLSLR